MELSEEEIIRNVKRIIEYKVISNYINNYDSRVIQGLLDLYYKQQKEIKELKEENTQLTNYLNDSYYVSADKIREKIEGLESLSKNITMQPNIYNYEIDLLKELLEE